MLTKFAKQLSLPNTTVIMNALSTEVLGDGSQVTVLNIKTVQLMKSMW
ncbi:hypothetical protein ACINWC348_1738 [Acinetobacter baumannii WC-348]|nr:hypothetical protein ACINWC348_1738 [Acinetobacter baumannii WC-348]